MYIGEIISCHDDLLHQQVTVTGDGSRHSTNSPVSRAAEPSASRTQLHLATVSATARK